ncbi:PEGA domain-containing protein, partial [bacterium AH-315-O15]|nr:PEGA domain-containing protein [bacterium AH-315-O15]
PVAPEPRPLPAPPPVAVAPVVEAPPPVVEAPPDVGLLRIDSDVPGAQVFIDRRFIGRVPVVAEGVTPGSHQLNVSAEGFDSVATAIDVVPGEHEIVVKLREVRLDVSLDVIHKHRFGSCRGSLVATPRGIRYETDNQNDGFTTALLDLETFEVDYLDKNLRVKLAQGRQFNFTDPEGDADRLFVFHRDVEKARERLGRGDTPAGD